jgi:D-alanyl-D-alanine carboxypeptidase/D-alanyl-D-alanine-endopeptidase (penicillin-binding protein 4)
MRRNTLRKIVKRYRFGCRFILHPSCPVRTRFFYGVSFILVFALSILLCGQARSSSLSIREQIEALLADSLLQKGMTGICIVDAATGDVVYERNSDNYFPPASNMKLITTAGALFLLKPEFRFSTPILTNGTVRGDTLMGDLIIYGKGDPTLTTADMKAIAQQIAIRSISVIRGNVLFDDTYFDTIPYGPGWMWDDLQYGFGAPISALSVNRNCISVFVMPGKAMGKSLQVKVVPETPAITVENLAKTGDTENIALTTTFEDGNAILTVSGSLPIGTGPYQYTRTIKQPSLMATVLFAQALKKQGITITGTVRITKTAGTIDTLFTQVSEPLLKILYDLDKYSSNFIAEHILKTIGAEIIGRPGTSEKGVEAITAYLQQHSIVSDSIIQRDGSGLSRYNLITPSQVTSILHYLYYCFASGPELMTVLPVSGADGTLSSRMGDPATNRRVRAKTGTMTHISTLSGYCITASGRILIFSIMMKDFGAPPGHVRAIQDRIVTALVESL